MGNTISDGKLWIRFGWKCYLHTHPNSHIHLQCGLRRHHMQWPNPNANFRWFSVVDSIWEFQFFFIGVWNEYENRVSLVSLGLCRRMFSASLLRVAWKNAHEALPGKKWNWDSCKWYQKADSGTATANCGPWYAVQVLVAKFQLKSFVYNEHVCIFQGRVMFYIRLRPNLSPKNDGQLVVDYFCRLSVINDTHACTS